MNKRLIEKIFALHFDTQRGSPYWLDVKNRLGFDPRDRVTSMDEFHLLGPMDVDALRTRPLTDFIPKALLGRAPEMILSETGGTTGTPCRRVFLPEEFESAFLAPWGRAARKRGFPVGGLWLFAGPGGPHIIGQAARAMARRLGSLEPFSVDCDVRWFKKQRPGSLGAGLYLDHVLEQAMNIIATQPIDVLFTTPPLLEALAERMDVSQRRRVRGVHLGGLGVSAEAYHRLASDIFPQAVLLPGYGNSLCGVAFEEEEAGPGEPPVYTVADPALALQIVPDSTGGAPRLDVTLPPGEAGRVVVHRLDPSFLIVNLVERDSAVYADASRRRLTAIAPARRETPRVQGVY